jgi:hypothetical protein
LPQWAIITISVVSAVVAIVIAVVVSILVIPGASRKEERDKSRQESNISRVRCALLNDCEETDETLI